MASLFVIRGNDQGRRYELEGPVITIGRDSSNLIQLHDTEVSRRHAELRHLDESDIFFDLGSSNGSFINGQTKTEHRLESGDQIQLGRTLMLYTRPVGDREQGISANINITTDALEADKSRIIHSVTQEEGSRIFNLDADLPGKKMADAEYTNLQMMYHTALAVSHTLDIDKLLDRIMELIFGWVKTDRGCIMLIDPETKDLVPKVRKTRETQPPDEKITISKTILDYVVSSKEGVLTSDAQQDERWDAGASILQMGVCEAICVPMQGRYDLVGLIYIDTRTSPQDLISNQAAWAGRATNQFSEEHLKMMIAIAHQAALAVEDTRYYSGMVQAERLAAIGQTVATLSHHIKNILQGIRGGSYLIEMGLDKHDESLIGKGWNIVDKNQTKISNLVLDMLTFSKDREPDLSEADMNRVVMDVLELMQVRADDLEVELRWSLDDQMPQLIFDPDGLHRAITNVVTNAIDAAYEAERDGKVQVITRLCEDSNLVEVVVDDNGVGISDHDLKTLFSPFISTKGGRGTGLGLPVSQKILKEHGGRIDVESAPDVGSRFILRVPIVLPGGNHDDDDDYGNFGQNAEGYGFDGDGTAMH